MADLAPNPQTAEPTFLAPVSTGSSSAVVSARAAQGEPSEATQAHQPAGKSVLGAEEIRRALSRIGHEILERTDGAGDVVLLGIPTRGVPLARRLAARLSQTEGIDVP